LLESENSKITILYNQNVEELSNAETRVADLTRNNNILVNQLSEAERINKSLKSQINDDLLPKIQKLESEAYEKESQIHTLESNIKGLESSKKNLKMQLK
jgi:chromosome segregation ATPase